METWPFIDTEQSEMEKTLKDLVHQLAGTSSKLAKFANSLSSPSQPSSPGRTVGKACGLVAPGCGITPSELSTAQAELKHRRFREQIFPDQLFADPAWDILLEMFIARARGKRVSVSDACIASAVPATTGLRWVKTLEQMKLIEREADSADGRRIILTMTDETAALVHDVIRFRQSLPKE